MRCCWLEIKGACVSQQFAMPWDLILLNVTLLRCCNLNCYNKNTLHLPAHRRPGSCRLPRPVGSTCDFVKNHWWGPRRVLTWKLQCSYALTYEVQLIFFFLFKIWFWIVSDIDWYWLAISICNESSITQSWRESTLYFFTFPFDFDIIILLPFCHYVPPALPQLPWNPFH